MSEKNSNWLKEMASAFNMSVKEFAACLGYARETLYQAANGCTNLKKQRLEIAQQKLDKINAELLIAEKARARERFVQRGKMIDSLVDRLSGYVGVNDANG